MPTLKVSPERLFALGEYALVLLNREIQFETNFFLKIWNNASIRHLVDGGSNHFFKFLDNLPEKLKTEVKLPDLASGDFDSATKESINRLKSIGCQITLTEDQEETDFTKALRVLRDHLNSSEALSKTRNIVCICEFTGRLDQIMANMNTLHKNVFLEDVLASSSNQGTKKQVFLVSSETISWLLPANHKSEILFETEVPNFTCGVIPLMGPTKYTSSGLKWDFTTDMICAFGGLVSTSNMVVQKRLEIIPKDNHSIFSLEFHSGNYIF